MDSLPDDVRQCIYDMVERKILAEKKLIYLFEYKIYKSIHSQKFQYVADEICLDDRRWNHYWDGEEFESTFH